MSGLDDGVRPKDCPGCGLHWADDRIETLAEARLGGGYRRKCHKCGQEWDDSRMSYGLKYAFRSTQPLVLIPPVSVTRDGGS